MSWPDKTVLIYEGKAGKPDYRHDDRAAIGFVDGHCKLVRPSETTALFWMVQDSKAK
jgi:prepilin-type processing-associated H-X9-DG protein